MLFWGDYRVSAAGLEPAANGLKEHCKGATWGGEEGLIPELEG